MTYSESDIASAIPSAATNIHVFVGAGPANLHRALKIKNMDPTAQMVIIDTRLKPDERQINRELSRANIFRFENNQVTQKLLEDGISIEDWEKVSYNRDFKHFQHGDDTVFTQNEFAQIQIRDLQQVLLTTLDKKSNDNSPLPILLNAKVDDASFESTEHSVLNILQTQGLIGTASPNIQIHVATGALQDDEKKDSIIYPDKAHYEMKGAAADITAMPVKPTHGTTTFIIDKDPKITCDELKAHQTSLDFTQWKEPLKEFGWTLMRPPRIRVFYANDVLYIGAEIPADMMGMEKEAYEETVTAYTRAIAGLVFPGIQDRISKIPVNPHLISRFETVRGERGQVLNTVHLNTVHKDTITIDGIERHANVQLFNHGDSRYLPHYQTGSGFVTAFLQNEIYAQIYKPQHFNDLFTWAKENKHLPDNQTNEQIRAQYTKMLGTADEGSLLQAFQTELYMALSRDIIEHNKDKVGRYLNALHSQTLDAFKTDFPKILKMYNNYHHPKLNEQDFLNVDKRSAVINLLEKSDNISFLREIMPQLLNKDFSTVGDDELLKLRDMHLSDYKINLEQKQKADIGEICEKLIQLTASKNTPESIEMSQHLQQTYDTFKTDKNINKLTAQLEKTFVDKKPILHTLQGFSQYFINAIKTIKKYVTHDDKTSVTSPTYSDQMKSLKAEFKKIKPLENEQTERHYNKS